MSCLKHNDPSIYHPMGQIFGRLFEMEEVMAGVIPAVDAAYAYDIYAICIFVLYHF